MTVRLVLAAVIAFLLCAAWAQQGGPTPPVDLSRINHLPWPHIGAPPPQGAPEADIARWRQESLTFAGTFAAIKGSWTTGEISSADELRTRVKQYEDLLRSVTSSPGYGNVLLADCLRRLSLTLAVQFELGHPGNPAVRELMQLDRVSLLDSAAFEGLLSEEFKLQRPSEGWKLTEDRPQFDSIFRSQGTTTNRSTERMLFGSSSTAGMMQQRDVIALIWRIVDTEGVERVELPALVEFHKRGGRLEDLKGNEASIYERIMGREMYKFKFAPLGLIAATQVELGVLHVNFDPHGKVLSGFTKLALQ